MKFLKSEYDQFIVAIKKHEFHENDFTFTKKRGMLYVEHQLTKATFCFFRKKESSLNSNLQFEDKITYYVGPKKEKLIESWELLMNQFDSWLKNI